jgi:hypothetical protein
MPNFSILLASASLRRVDGAIAREDLQKKEKQIYTQIGRQQAIYNCRNDKLEEEGVMLRPYLGSTTARGKHLIRRMRLSWHWLSHVIHLCHHGWVRGTIGLAWQ